MKFRLKTPMALVTLMAMTCTAPGVAWAGGKHDYDRHSGGYHHKHHQHKHQYHKHRHHKHHRQSGYKFRQYDSDDDEKLLIGLLLGGVIGYAIGDATQSYAPDPAPYPATSAPNPVQSYNSVGNATTCLQEREYQMKVMVGGKAADAYGTACLQPDGSWYRGPAHLVSH